MLAAESSRARSHSATSPGFTVQACSIFRSSPDSRTPSDTVDDTAMKVPAVIPPRMPVPWYDSEV